MTRTLTLSEAAGMLPAKAAAAFLGVSVRAFYDLGIPCYRFGPRLTRWDKADLEEYKAKCRSIRIEADGVLTSIVVSQPVESGLLNSFRKAGADIKPNSTMREKAPVYPLKQRA